MFHDDEPPVSLFSFQDIITSLTGIMIFFLLMLALNIFQVKNQSQNDSVQQKELAQIRKKNNLLKKQIEEIKSDINRYNKKISLAQQKDDAALTVEIQKLERELKKLKYRKGDFEKKIQQEQDQYSRLGKQEKELKKGKDELEENLRQNQLVSEETSKKKEEITRLRKAIEKRKKQVDVTVSSSIAKTPILVECSIHKILVQNRKEGTKREFLREGPIIQKMSDKVINYLRLFDPNYYYFCFFVKPSFAQQIGDFVNSFQSTVKSAHLDYGEEPILETESIINE